MTERAQDLFNLSAEQSVLGALLIDNDAIDRMGDLEAKHFYRGDHQLMFAEIVRQIGAGKPCDVISLNEVVGGQVQDCLVYAHQVASSTPSSANIARYAGIVRDKAIKRGLVALGRVFVEMAETSVEDAGTLVDRAASHLEKLAEARIRREPVRAADELAAHVEALQNRLDGIGAKAISTGFVDLDKRLSGGMRRGEVIVLAARPKMGKTALALNVAANVAVDQSALVLSMEMPKAQLHDRNLANLGRIPLSGLLQPADLTDADWAGLTSAIQKIDKLNLYLDDQGGLRLLDVRTKARQTKRRHGLDVLVVDYLQLMEGDGDNRNAQIEGITRGLKSLAKELDIAIILLSQLNRELEKRPNKRPQPSDLRDSGAIEQDADAVIFLYRDEVYNPDSPDKGICEVDVALCRQGAPGRVALTYFGEQTRFADAFKWQPPVPQISQRKGRGLAEHL
jgi:replicative DNA helicase